LYRSPRLLIFDEATSALDPDAERTILATLCALKKHHSILWISHKLSTLHFADRVLRVEKRTLSEVPSRMITQT
jgi:ABC-type bacteriocin/lantibiotic exporter with double-glycine peptidase domain